MVGVSGDERDCESCLAFFASRCDRRVDFLVHVTLRLDESRVDASPSALMYVGNGIFGVCVGRHASGVRVCDSRRAARVAGRGVRFNSDSAELFLLTTSPSQRITGLAATASMPSGIKSFERLRDAERSARTPTYTRDFHSSLHWQKLSSPVHHSL